MPKDNDSEKTSKADAKTEKPSKADGFMTMKASHNWLYGLVAVLIVALILMFGVAIGRHSTYGRGFAIKTAGPVPMFGRGGEFGTRMGGGMRGFDGGNVTIDGQTRASGVVTSVNGSDFTLAANGATTNVTTNSSTQYQNGDQVKQNDSVVVLGSTSNNTLTATQIVINP